MTQGDHLAMAQVVNIYAQFVRNSVACCVLTKLLHLSGIAVHFLSKRSSVSL